MPDAPRFDRAALLTLAERLFATVNVPPAARPDAARHLVLADERGVASHGVARLPFYVARFRRGLIDPDAPLTIERETMSTLALDAHNGFGMVQGPRAMAMVIDRAETSGLCLATLRHGNHFGIAGAYTMMAARRGMIGVAMTNASPLVAPLFGAEARLGTNPISVAVPTGPGPDDPPVVLDMSTSTVAWGKVEIARRSGTPVPLGWALDEDGDPTSDPHAARWLTPLGGSPETGGHKGYGLGVMVDILCGPLAGAAWGTRVSGARGPDRAAGIGHTFMAWRVDAFRDPAEFYADLATSLAELRETPVSPAYPGKRVLIPGDPERDAERDARQRGIPVDAAVVAELRTLASAQGVPFDLVPK